MSRVGGVRGTYSTPGPYSSDRDLLSPGWKSWTEGKSSVWVAAQVRNLRTTSPSISGMERSFTIWFASQRGPVTRGDPSQLFSGGLKVKSQMYEGAETSGPLIDPKDDCLANESVWAAHG